MMDTFITMVSTDKPVKLMGDTNRMSSYPALNLAVEHSAQSTGALCFCFLCGRFKQILNLVQTSIYSYKYCCLLSELAQLHFGVGMGLR